MSRSPSSQSPVVHSMKVACRRSGLSPHVLRVWEKRYNAVTPLRSETNRRGYREDDIVRLHMLGELTKLGHRIGQIAGLSCEDLDQLLAREHGAPSVTGDEFDDPAEVVARLLRAVEALDADGLFQVMEAALVRFGLNGFLQHVVGPLVVRVGEAWTQGDLRISQKNLASRVLRDFLSSATRNLVVSSHAPEILVATPTQQLHELGAMMVTAAAQNHGWKALYLGPCLPAVEIAGAAARRPNIRAVALSIVYPEGDPNVAEELEILSRHLPEHVALLVGGRATGGYKAVLEKIGARTVSSLGEFTSVLTELEGKMAVKPSRMAVLGLMILLGLTGCAGVSPALRLDELALATPESWSESRASKAPVDRAWLERFNDAALTAMVDEAMANNPDIQASALALDIARQNVTLAGVGRRPTVDLNLEGRRARRNFIGFPFGPDQGGQQGGQIQSTTGNTFGVSLNSNWELDLWGRVRAGEAAAIAEMEALEADFIAARTSLAGQIAKAWFALIEAGQQLQLAEDTLASLLETEEVIRQRFETGEAGGRGTGTDLRLARVDIATTEAGLQQRNEQVARARRQLEALLGRYPAGAKKSPVTLPDLPADPPAGLPSDLLLRRPDIRSAERRFAGQGSRVREARLAVFPRFSLTGSGGTSSEDLKQILNSDFGVWSLAGQVIQPILTAGQLRAESSKRKTEETRALRQLQSTVLQAFLEVETALTAETWLARQEKALKNAVDLAHDADSEARANLRDGTGDILTVFEAQTRLLNTRSQYIQVRRARLDNRIDLHLALGGDFKPALEEQP